MPTDDQAVVKAPSDAVSLFRAALPKGQREERVSPSAVLKDVGFDASWIEIEE